MKQLRCWHLSSGAKGRDFKNMRYSSLAHAHGSRAHVSFAFRFPSRLSSLVSLLSLAGIPENLGYSGKYPAEKSRANFVFHVERIVRKYSTYCTFVLTRLWRSSTRPALACRSGRLVAAFGSLVVDSQLSHLTTPQALTAF